MPEVRLIDANAAADKIMREIETHADEIGIGAVAILIAFARALRDETDFPTIEPEVRHGRWVFDSKYRLMCNMCGSNATRDEIGITLTTDYCHSCGAKMDGGAENA